MLYPICPSIVEKTSVVNVSTKSTSCFAKLPELFNLSPASNSIIGRFARDDSSIVSGNSLYSALFRITDLWCQQL